MNIVLICENHKFVLNEECPEVHDVTAPNSARETYDNWVLSNNKAKCYMLANMSDILRMNHEEYETVLEIWESLRAVFGQQSDQCRHEATRTYMNIKMKKGTSLKEHVLNMINTIHYAKVHGGNY
ncbi:uncharacterized protein LOC133814924 [Humulus lupulus]|uniref:uncharacterized protein LOC133814924 n=1 Tax=Humulus lupulus TaxID=3486 RepID=UPI002B414F69|nr:uncharacterized protein LOC133814924 [Humulus lupulus]